MGLEAYLFRVNFKHPVEEKTLDELLFTSGFSRTNDPSEDLSTFRNYYYELKTILGVTEAHMLIRPKGNSVSGIYVRFSVMSPPTVIKQTFDLLKSLKEQVDFELKDTEISNHLYNVLRSKNTVDKDYQGLSKEEKSKLEAKAIIPLDVAQFKMNEYEVYKRKLVLENSPEKEPIRNKETISQLKSKGFIGKYFGWVTKFIKE